MKSKILLPIAGLLISSGAVVAQTTFVQEDFEGGSFPGTWSQTTSATDGGFLYGTAASLSSTYYPIDGANATQMVATNDDACNCDKSADYLILPTVDLSGASTVWLDADVFFGGGTYQGNTEVAKVKYSIDGGTTWTDASTIAGSATWQSITVDVSAAAGNSSVMVAFHYDDATGWVYGIAVDNVKLYEPHPVDGGVNNLSIAKYVMAGNVTVSGTVKNYGSSAITAMDIIWTDGTNTYTDNLTGLNVAPLASYNFSHTTPLAAIGGGTYALDVYTSVSGDGNNANDTATAAVAGMTFATTKTVVGEEATGTWCGWCPRGAVALEDMESQSNWIGIAVHNADPMVVSAYDAGIGGFISGYPSGVVDRILVGDPTDFATQRTARLQEISPADVSITNVALNQSTGELTFDVNANFAVTADGNFRLNAVITENNVTGTASGYDQVNYYSFQSQNLALTGAGHDWQQATNPVLAADMEYDHVARAILGGFNGTNGSVPASVVAGNTYTQSYSFNVVPGLHVNEMHIIGLLHDADNSGEILNAGTVDAPVSIKEIDALNFSANVYPNPTSDFATISLSLQEAGNVSIDITDVSGKVVKTNHYGSLAGDQNFILDGTELATGMYLVKITVDEQVLTKRINISK